MNPNDVIKNGYHDWLELLQRTNSMSLLEDPYNIWLEAFTSATLFERIGVIHAIGKMLKDAKTLDEQNMLTKVITLIESKGLSK